MGATHPLSAALQKHQTGRLPEAEADYRAILEIEPNNSDANHLLGVVLAQQGRGAEAEGLLRKAIAIRKAPHYCFDLGLTLRALGRLEEAVIAYGEALAIKPHYAEAHYSLGNALKALGRLEAAAAAYRDALAQRPAYAEALFNLGNTLHDLGRPAKAITAYRGAAAMKPQYAEAHYNLGCALEVQGQLEEAGAAFRRAVDARPHFPEAWCNLGGTLQQLGRIDEAVSATSKALDLKPDYPDAVWNRSLIRLAQGDFAQGWEDYEARWQAKQLRTPRRDFVQPLWSGEEIAGQTILLHAEQGLGDTLQFVRYAPLVAKRRAHVILEVPMPLVRLLKGMPGVERIIAVGQSLPTFDWHCPLMSLPRAFGTRLETIPAAVPYLHPAPHLVAAWRDHMPADGLLRVGLVWAGNPRQSTPGADALDRRRSMPLWQLARLANVPGVRYFSLQKDGEAATQAKTPPAGLGLIDLMGKVSDFADTAALIANLDLVIGVDTSVIHLAGAMGKPVWVMSRFDGCWRWLREREDSPWYPTLRLFRQHAPGDWTEVVERVRDALSNFTPT